MIHIAYIERDKRSQFTFEQIAVVLRARGFDNRLQVFATPEEALEQIPLERPDIIFLDLLSYDGKKSAGLELASYLHLHPLCKNTFLVAMADYALPGDRSAALAAGCHDFLPKPARYQAVEEAIKSLLSEPVQ